MIEKLLPQNLEAECGVLGSIIIDPEAVTQVAEFLVPADFYRNTHRTIYEVIAQLYEAQEPADFITICDELQRRNKLEEVGGSSYITSLINQVPTSGNVEFYARIVERTALLRRLIHAAGEIAAMAYDQQESDARLVVAQAEEMIHRLWQGKRMGETQALHDILHEYLDELDQAYTQSLEGQASIRGIPTKFTLLDLLTGGLQRSDLIVLAARPGLGKTSLALNIGQQVMGDAVKEGFSVLVFSLEMAKMQLAQRLISMESKIDQTRLRLARIHEGEWDEIVHAVDHLSEGQMWINDTPAISLLEMRSVARRIQTEHGLDLVIVDYLQLMQATLGEKVENRTLEISMISRGLKALARELKVPVLALAQLSRAVEQREDKVPRLSDLREGGSIEADSDLVLFIHRDPQKPGNERGYPLNLILAKHRNGPVGSVELWFDPSLTRFENMVKQERE